jgi:formyltetrahydrofolate-dependent phosphoribosylglycinamide formyltransferase
MQILWIFHKVLLHICNMFEKLQRKWKVNGLGLLLILTTFALGGSLCGFVSRKIIGLFNMDKGVAWVILYIILLTLTWPLCVLLVSIPLGKFKFFRNYISKVFKRMTGNSGQAVNKSTTTLAIFASGAGSNAQKIIEYFKNDAAVNIAVVVCNNPGAGVLQIAESNGISILMIEKERFANGDGYVQELKKRGINEIILAGFLWKVPASLLREWPGAIINIHPALLPKYGGKGMYGARVHECVIANKEKESGISIHYVDEIYDHGAVIHQSRCEVTETDTAESLAQKIHELEHRHYPAVIAEIIKAKTSLNKQVG